MATSSGWSSSDALLTGVLSAASTATRDRIAAREHDPSAVQSDRYEDLGLIGLGGHAQVRRVRDRRLGRVVAMKVPHRTHETPPGRARFTAEAQLVASLDHPNIVTVLDFGQLDCGRLFFTMPIVSDDTFTSVLRSAHAEGFQIDTLHRLISILRTVSSAVGFAHTRGVLHRDLKPHNVMVGDHGRVLVLDWGLAKEWTDETLAVVPQEGDATITRTGVVRGTPAYMAPEQARGDWGCVDQRSDVFALGAMLYEVLCGHPPYGRGLADALKHARNADIPPLPNRSVLPGDLVRTCYRALSSAPSARYASATEMAQALDDWLAGVAGLARAQKLLAEATHLRQNIAQAVHRLEALESGTTSDDRREALIERLGLMETWHEQRLREALFASPGHTLAHQRLADLYQQTHKKAELEGRRLEAARNEYLLRQHDRGRHAGYLLGRGWWSLRMTGTASVAVCQEVRRDGRLVAEPLNIAVPCDDHVERVELPMGSYIALVETAAGTIRYPFHIEREQEWTGALGDRDGRLYLPRKGEIAPDACYIPAGPAWIGGDDKAFGTPVPRARVWVDGFVMQRTPVTNADFLVFMNDLVARGCTAEALRWVPRERGSSGQLGQMVYGQRADGTFCLAPDADGDVWDPQWAVTMITFDGILAYADWLSCRTGRRWRLPHEVEWTKAARGVDRRTHVWGTDSFDPTWCWMGESHGDHRSLPCRVGTHPVDRSVYGVMDLAGGMLDTTSDLYTVEGPTVGPEGQWTPPVTGRDKQRVVLGGNWLSSRGKSRLCYRGPVEDEVRSALNGFRLVYSLGPPA